MTKFEVTCQHANHGELKTTIEIDANESFASEYVEMIRAARKNLASRFVDYEAFGSDSAYLARLDEVGKAFRVVEVEMVSDAPLRRYVISGAYSTDDGGRWDDHVMARNDEEAEFRAKWEMAENEHVKPSEIKDFQNTMEEITIDYCVPEPVSLSEAKSYMEQVARLIIPGDAEFSDDTDHRGDADALYGLVAKARVMLAGQHIG